jgi:serine/threonine protein kinase
MPFGCVYGMLEEKEKERNNGQKFISKVVESNFFIENQIEAQNILYPDYKDFFVLFDSYELISMGEIDENIVVQNQEDKRYLVRYENKKWIPLPNYLTSSSTTRIYVRRLLNVHRNLLKNIYILSKKGIVHNNIHRNNILLLLDNDEPRLTNFGLSITNKSISKYFFRYSPEFIYYTFECHLCAYIVDKGVRVLSYMNLGEVIEKYNLNALVPKLERDDSKEFEKYIGWKSELIIEEIAKWRFTWDNYALTIVMIEIVEENIAAGLDLTWYKTELYKCIHANPNKRISINQTNKLLVSSLENIHNNV